jgi:glycosyltransferase involved in cell wall biosynthesis
MTAMDLQDQTITILIPTFQRPKLTERAVRSVLGQTNPNVVAWVFDNASGDETAEVIGRLADQDSRVRYTCHDHNIGPLANFNFAMKQVETAYFTLLSSDDILLPEFAAEAIEWFQRHPEAAFVGGAVLLMTDHGEVLDVRNIDWPREGLYTPKESVPLMTTGRFPVQTAIAYRRDVVEEFGTYDPDCPLADYDYETVIAACKPIVISHKPCGIVMRHIESVTKDYGPTFYWSTFRAIIQKFETRAEISDEVRAEGVPRLQRFAKDKVFKVALRSCLQGQFADATEGAKILRDELGQRLRPVMVTALAWLCRKSLIALKAAKAVRRAVRFLKQRRCNRTHRGFSRYGAFLTE